MSGSRSSSRNVNIDSNWSKRENKLFEEALACYGEGTPDRWHKVARAMGGIKTADEVRRHYEILNDDVTLIESGGVPFPNYNTQGAWNKGNKRKLQPFKPCPRLVTLCYRTPIIFFTVPF